MLSKEQYKYLLLHFIIDGDTPCASININCCDCPFDQSMQCAFANKEQKLYRKNKSIELFIKHFSEEELKEILVEYLI